MFSKNVEYVVGNLLFQHIVTEPSEALHEDRKDTLNNVVEQFEHALFQLYASIIFNCPRRLLQLVPGDYKTSDNEESFRAYFEYARKQESTIETE
jgi:hypothetical protein